MFGRIPLISQLNIKVAGLGSLGPIKVDLICKRATFVTIIIYAFLSFSLWIWYITLPGHYYGGCMMICLLVCSAFGKMFWIIWKKLVLASDIILHYNPCSANVIRVTLWVALMMGHLLFQLPGLSCNNLQYKEMAVIKSRYAYNFREYDFVCGLFLLASMHVENCFMVPIRLHSC